MNIEKNINLLNCLKLFTSEFLKGSEMGGDTYQH